jgi:flagellar hook-basal body complex protein FliE
MNASAAFIALAKEMPAQPGVLPALAPAADSSGDSAGSTGFASSLQKALHAADDKQHVAEDKMTAVDSGSSDDLVGAMLASQEASLSFALLMQVRNKVVGAVDELMKLQL